MHSTTIFEIDKKEWTVQAWTNAMTDLLEIRNVPATEVDSTNDPDYEEFIESIHLTLDTLVCVPETIDIEPKLPFGVVEPRETAGTTPLFISL